jgi:hypothetical protein
VEITCPPAGKHVLVTGQGSGSGSGGTICVRGTITDQDVGMGLPTTIRACVVSGWITPPPPDPNSPPSGWVDTTPTGQDWLAQGVGVPGSSSTGVQCTAVAWFKTGTNQWSEPVSVHFFAGGPNPIDCCSGMTSEGVISAATSLAFQSWPPPPPPLPPNLGSGTS